MWTIFFRTLKDRRALLLIYVISSIILLWMYIALFPAFKEQSASMEELIKNYPESFLKAFNVDVKAFTTIEGFLATEQFSFVWPIMVIFMVVGFAGSAFAGEIEKGTIDLLLSEPISRLKLFLSRYFVGIFMIFVFTFFSIFAAIPISKIYSVGLNAESFLTIAILGFMFSMAIFSIGIFLSSIFSDKGKVFFASGGLLVAMYVLNILSALKENLADLKYFSFMNLPAPRAQGIRGIDTEATVILAVHLLVSSPDFLYIFPVY